MPACSAVGVGFHFYYTNDSGLAGVLMSCVGSDVLQSGRSTYMVPTGTTLRLVVVDASVSGTWKVVDASTMGGGAGSVSIGSNEGSTQTRNITIGESAAAGGGTGAISIGYLTNANAAYATAIGNNLSGSGSYAQAAGAVALGGSYASGTSSFAAANPDVSGTYGAQGAGSVSLGGSTKASGASSFACGNGSLAAQTGKYAFASGVFSATTGDAQTGTIVLRGSTTTNTSTSLTSDGTGAVSTSNQLIVSTGQAMAFTGTLIGKQTGSANIAAYTITGTLVNNGGTVTMPTGTLTLIGSDSIALTTSPTLAADNTNKGLTVTSGNKLTTAIHWVCTINSTEVV